MIVDMDGPSILVALPRVFPKMLHKALYGVAMQLSVFSAVKFPLISRLTISLKWNDSNFRSFLQSTLLNRKPFRDARRIHKAEMP